MTGSPKTVLAMAAAKSALAQKTAVVKEAPKDKKTLKASSLRVAANAAKAAAVAAEKAAEEAERSQPSDGLAVRYVKRTREETPLKKAAVEKTPKKAAVEKTPKKAVVEKTPKKAGVEKSTSSEKSPKKRGAEKPFRGTTLSENSPKKRVQEVAAVPQAPKPDKPNAKKPIGGGYGVFLKEQREEIAKSVGGVVTAVTKKAAELYKALTEEERKPYHDKYVELAETYKAAVAEYENACKLAGHTAETTPTKKSKQADGLVTPPKFRMAKVAAESAPALDADCLHEAKGLGYEQAFRSLTAQKVLIDKNVPHDKIVRALRASGGVEKKAFTALRTFCPPSQAY